MFGCGAGAAYGILSPPCQGGAATAALRVQSWLPCASLWLLGCRVRTRGSDLALVARRVWLTICMLRSPYQKELHIPVRAQYGRPARRLFMDWSTAWRSILVLPYLMYGCCSPMGWLPVASAAKSPSDWLIRWSQKSVPVCWPWPVCLSKSVSWKKK